jgi:hypothetical protein
LFGRPCRRRDACGIDTSAEQCLASLNPRELRRDQRKDGTIMFGRRLLVAGEAAPYST